MNKKAIHIALLFIFITTGVFGQFEQKFTMNFSIGLINPYGESDYLETDLETEYFTGTYAQPYPYLMSNFGAGAIFTGGIQVNYNRRFSMAFNVQFFNIRKTSL